MSGDGEVIEGYIVEKAFSNFKTSCAD